MTPVEALHAARNYVEKVRATAADVYTVSHQPVSLCDTARTVHKMASTLQSALQQVGAFAPPMKRFAMLLKVPISTFATAEKLMTPLKKAAMPLDRAADAIRNKAAVLVARLTMAEMYAKKMTGQDASKEAKGVNSTHELMKAKATIFIAQQDRIRTELDNALGKLALLNTMHSQMKIAMNALSPLKGVVHAVNDAIAKAKNVPVLGWFVQLVEAVGDAVGRVVDGVLSALGVDALFAKLNNAINPLAKVVKEFADTALPQILKAMAEVLKPLMESAEVLDELLGATKDFGDVFADGSIGASHLKEKWAWGGPGVVLYDYPLKKDGLRHLWGTAYTGKYELWKLVVKSNQSVAGDGKGGVWITDHDKNRIFHYNGPSDSKPRTSFSISHGATIASDGIGGCFSICVQDSTFSLWHHCDSGEEKLFNYPKTSKMTGDGAGGCWILAPTKGVKNWGLWHVAKQTNGKWTERRFYEYPESTVMIGDGRGGAYCHCKTGDEWWVWRVDESGEEQLYKYPKHMNAHMVPDHRGGGWMASTEHGDIWHFNADHDRKVAEGFKGLYHLMGDGEGGAFVACNGRLKYVHC